MCPHCGDSVTFDFSCGWAKSRCAQNHVLDRCSRSLVLIPLEPDDDTSSTGSTWKCVSCCRYHTTSQSSKFGWIEQAAVQFFTGRSQFGWSTQVKCHFCVLCRTVCEPQELGGAQCGLSDAAAVAAASSTTISSSTSTTADDSALSLSKRRRIEVTV